MGGECVLPDDAPLLRLTAATQLLLATLGDGDRRGEAADLLLAEPRLIDAALARFDADGDGDLRLREALGVDLLAMAREIVA